MPEEGRTQAERLAAAWAEVATQAADAAARVKLAAKAAEIVAHVTASVAREVELDRMVSVALDQTVRTLGAQAAHVYQVSEERRELSLLGQRNVPSDLVDRLTRVPLDAPLLAARAASTRQLQLVEDAAELDPSLTLARELLSRTGSASIVSAPLIAFDRLVGVLTYTLAEPRRFSPEELGAISTIAEIFAVGLTNARAYDERKRAEEALRASEERFRLITENVQDVIFRYRVVAPRGFEYVSPSVTPLTGYTPEDHYADPDFAFRIVHPEDHPLLEAILQSPASFSNQTVAIRWVCKDGSVIWTEQRNVPVYDEAGHVTAIVGTVRDVTARRSAEEELRRSEESLARAQRIAHLGNWDWDLRTNGLRWSDEIFRIFGLHPQEFGATYDAFLRSVHQDDRDAVKRAVDLALYEQKPYSIDHRVVRPDGTVRIVHEQADVVRDKAGRPIRMVGTVQDITERKQAEEALETLSRQNQLILNSAGEGIYGLDRQGRTTFVNPAAAKMVGWTDTDLIGKSMHDILHYAKPDGTPYPADECPIYAAFRDGDVHRVANDVFWRKDGSSFPVEYVSTPIWDDGEVVGAVVAFMDITERKRAEEERRHLLVQEQQARAAAEAERAQLQAILDNAANGILFVDATTGRITTNPPVTRVFGRPLTPEGGAVQCVGQVRRPDGHVLMLEELPSSRALRGERVPGEDLVISRPDGSQLPVLASAAPVLGPGQEIIGAVVVFQDISVLRELERLREEWTSVVAHDLRAPITVISGYAQILAGIAAEEHGSERERRAFAAILSNTKRLARMVSDLLDASTIEARHLRLVCRPVDLPSLIRMVVEQTCEITRGHAVRVYVDGVIPQIEADPDRIQQVLVNLLSNAAKYSYPETDIDVRVARRDAEVEVSVTDRGEGISSEDLPRLFSRFHRARRAEAEGVTGLGLGLYITKGLVEAHGGHIWAESVPGQTTTFHFTLPLKASAD